MSQDAEKALMWMITSLTTGLCLGFFFGHLAEKTKGEAKRRILLLVPILALFLTQAAAAGYLLKILLVLDLTKPVTPLRFFVDVLFAATCTAGLAYAGVYLWRETTKKQENDREAPVDTSVSKGKRFLFILFISYFISLGMLWAFVPR